MVIECPGYSVVRERHSGLFECVRSLPGLMDRTIALEQPIIHVARAVKSG
jgi:hypothetical protein